MYGLKKCIILIVFNCTMYNLNLFFKKNVKFEPYNFDCFQLYPYICIRLRTSNVNRIRQIKKKKTSFKYCIDSIFDLIFQNFKL